MVDSIDGYALLGDLHTAALVSRDGSIDWLCMPRFDSPACFAALLHNETAGFWQLRPAADGAMTRRYRGDTLVLESEWTTPEGVVRVVDCMPPRGEAADIVRLVEGVSGSVRMHMELRMRFDYGRIVPWVSRIGEDLHAIAGPDSIWLRTDAPLEARDMSTYSDFTVDAGQTVSFVLTYELSHNPRPAPIDARAAVADTEQFWLDWIAKCTYEGRWQPAVRRAIITLKALTYAPTGGIVAAATTSLPEQPGGPRNWDYRYCWLRDSTFTLQAMLGTGFIEEAEAWREWLLRAAAGDPADLQIMYGLDGTRRIPELELDWLDGYQGSAPVRIGNAAAGQFQLDVWGETLDSLHLARTAGLESSDAAWNLQKALLNHLAEAWKEPDNGLWEVRGPRRHFVHSKVMAWVGLDRGVRAVEEYGHEGPAERWRAARDEIHAEVCALGYDTKRNTFTQFYGSRGLDAAVLLMPRVGFLPWDDPRVIGTVSAVQDELCQDGFLLRYRPEEDGGVDGLPGGEGAFLACTFWLADALHGVGRTEEATTLFERLLDLCTDLGMLSEEYDIATGQLIGNTPQAFSLVGLVNTARFLSGTTTTTDGSQHPDPNAR